MTDHTHCGRWVLLDPPCGQGYARRASLREKADAPEAPFPSIDLILLSGAVREAGFTPVYLDAQIRLWGWPRLIQEMRAIRPKGVISLLSSARIDEEMAQLRVLKESLAAAVYVVGSIHLVLDSLRVRQLMEAHDWLSGVVLNTAENNFSQVIAGGNAAPHNVALRRDNGIHAPEASATYGEGLHMPMPQHAIFKDRRYFFPQSKRKPVTCTQMSFGCPYRCEFCLDNALYRKMRYRRTDDVVAELEEIDRLGFREVYFKDLTFGLNKRITAEVLERLSGPRLRLRWLCTTRVDVATPRLLRLMKNAGCYGIEFGVESGLRHRRAANGKPIDDDEIRTVFHNCRRLGIETTAFVMIGFEDETEAEIRTTIEFITSLRADYASYNVVNALPGTPLAERAREEGFLRVDETDHTFHRSNLLHKHLTPDRLEALRAGAVRSFYRRPSTALLRLWRMKSFFELAKLVRLSRAAI